MPFSHHSHSGTFCPGHAQDSLEEIVKTAIAKDFRVFALTEHMPRHAQDRYDEELEAGTTLESMIENEAKYVSEARRLRDKYCDKLSVPIGFESEWCGHHSFELIQQSLQSHPYDFFLGSIHHVRGVPIDYDQASYEKARTMVGGTDKAIFETFFDEQLDMVRALRPPVIGHFDLIRLKSDTPDLDWQSLPTVWAKILRNLDFIASYGGILEINTAALRKGMAEPYPKSEICREFLLRNGRFCLSDDSHGIAQVATNYDKLLAFLHKNNIQTLHYLEHLPHAGNSGDDRFPALFVGSVQVHELQEHMLLQTSEGNAAVARTTRSSLWC